MVELTRNQAREHAELPGHGWVREPELAFHPDRPADRSSHPLDGLLQFGPYSGSLINRVFDPIRVAGIAPAGGLATIDRLLRELDERHKPRERKNYLRPFPGFSQVFRVRAVAGESRTRIELPRAFDDELAASRAPHLLLAERLTREIQALRQHRHEFDVLMIFLPGRWRAGFWGGKEEDFDLHDHLKAVTALEGLPIQIVNDGDPSTAVDYYCRCSVAWRLGIALYCKAGGVPWKLAPADDGTAYIGLSYALRPKTAEGGRFVTCCSQVFDADGAGLEFIAYSPDDVVEVKVDEWGDNPFLSRVEMRRVMARSLTLYQRRHGGRTPQRIVVHKTSEFKRDEVEGCFDALQPVGEIELLQVQQETPWRGLLIEAPRRGGRKGSPGNYPLLRGSYLPLGRRETLVWTQGNAPGPVGGGPFFKEGKGIPSPLMLRRYAGHGGWERNCSEVLALTKMDWNTDSLYARLPVTVGFAQTLARTIKRMDRLGNRVFPFRLFI